MQPQSNDYAFPKVKFRKLLHFPTIYNIFATFNVLAAVSGETGSSPKDHLPTRPPSRNTPARMAESVDALVSNTSGAIRAGSIPAPGTH